MSGGVFASTDGGQTWSVRGRNHAPVDIGPLVIDPSSSVIFAGGDGGVRSSRFGYAWTLPTLTGTTVEALAIDPSDSDVVYAGTRGQGTVHRSDDRGLSWTAVGGTCPAFR